MIMTIIMFKNHFAGGVWCLSW